MSALMTPLLTFQFRSLFAFHPNIVCPSNNRIQPASSSSRFSQLWPSAVGSSNAGTLSAATESEAGSPRTCAIRAAHPLRTEFACGEMLAVYAAGIVVASWTKLKLNRLPSMLELFDEQLARN